MQKLKNPLVHDYMVRKRGETFSGGVFVKGDRAGMKALTSVAAGTATAIMGDLRDVRGVNIEFFGKPAPTNSFPARLARKKSVPLIALQIRRVWRNPFRSAINDDCRSSWRGCRGMTF